MEFNTHQPKNHNRRSLSPFLSENNNENEICGLQVKHTNTFMRLISARD